MTSMQVFKATSRICALARCGFILRARKVFEEMPDRDTIAWNAMITNYARLGVFKEATMLFDNMRFSGIKLDDFTFTAVLSVSADTGNCESGRKIHALVVSSGFGSSLPVCNSLVDMYGKCSCPTSASRVFNQMTYQNDISWCSMLFAYTQVGDFSNACWFFQQIPNRNTIAWNILIRGYCQFGELELATEVFKEMQVSSNGADLWTFSSIMNACGEREELDLGCMFHGIILKNGCDSSVEVNNSVLSFYSNLSYTDSAQKIFKLMEGRRTLASWNAMIDSYVKAGNLDEALCLFTNAPERNVVSWTSLIAGYMRNGSGEEAFSIFVSMVKSNLRPDEFTFSLILQTCSSLAVLSHGKMVHALVIQTGFTSYVYVGDGLIDMYAKCGDIRGSILVFDRIQMKDLVSWNTMLFAFTLHGRAPDALNTYQKMEDQGILPDKVTFLGLLMSCSHSGLVEKGRLLYHRMKIVYNLTPDEDHLSCMIDMLSRAGHLKEASRLLDDLSRLTRFSRHDATDSSKALLGACTFHGELKIGRRIGEELVDMKPQEEVGYVMLSNMYSATGQWEEAEKVRKAMLEKGVKKVPGCSWIEVREMVFVFVSGTHHCCLLPHMNQAFTMLNLLHGEMRKPCFC